MKRIIKSLLLIVCFILLISCNKKNNKYVIFNYNCEGQTYYKCEIINNKIGCNMPDPVCKGYKFLGWYKANDSENKANLSLNFYSNLILHARWEKTGEIEEPSSSKIHLGNGKYILLFDSNGGTGGQTEILEVTYGSNMPNINRKPPTRNGYTFMGWYDEPDYKMGIEYYDATGMPIRGYDRQENITLYAGWKAQGYELSFNGNGGSGGQTQSLNATYNSNMPNINKTQPIRSGYTFMGWYDNPDYTKGTQYYNSSNQPVKKYDKKRNITLYAGWKAHILTIEYNGNGGTWKSTNNTYGVNASGTVILKSTRQIYKQEIKYGTKLESNGLIDYNGTLFNWKKDKYIINKGKEYIINNIEIDQTRQYTAVELANYGGCDLSKRDCIITVKVNWKKEGTGLGSEIRVSEKVKQFCRYILNPEKLKIRLYRCPCKVGTTTYNCMYTSALPGGGSPITRHGMGTGDPPFETEIANQVIDFVRYQKGAFSYEEPSAVINKDTHEFAKAFIILFKGDFFSDYRFKINNDGEVEFPTGNCTQCYSEANMKLNYDSGKYKSIIDEIYNETKYFILVNDDGSITNSDYAGSTKPDGPTNVTIRWSRNGMNFIDILKNMRTSTESESFAKYYRKSNIYDCRNLKYNN